MLCGGVVVAAICGGQEGPHAPAIDITVPERVLLLDARDPCKVDFANMRVEGENARYTAKLKHGEYKHKYKPYGYESVELAHVFCFAEAKRAILDLKWLECGGSCSGTGVVQVIGIRGNHPVVEQQFVYDSHASGTGAEFDPTTRTLTITGRSNDGSPNCCAENFDVVIYKWETDKFVQQEYKRMKAPRPEK